MVQVRRAREAAIGAKGRSRASVRHNSPIAPLGPLAAPVMCENISVVDTYKTTYLKIEDPLQEAKILHMRPVSRGCGAWHAAQDVSKQKGQTMLV